MEPWTQFVNCVNAEPVDLEIDFAGRRLALRFEAGQLRIDRICWQADRGLTEADASYSYIGWNHVTILDLPPDQRFYLNGPANDPACDFLYEEWLKACGRFDAPLLGRKVRLDVLKLHPSAPFPQPLIDILRVRFDPGDFDRLRRVDFAADLA